MKTHKIYRITSQKLTYPEQIHYMQATSLAELEEVWHNGKSERNLITKIEVVAEGSSDKLIPSKND